MKIDLNELAQRVEKSVPTAKALPIVEENQIIITFSNRADVELALLTPYYQTQIKKGTLGEKDVITLIGSVKAIALPLINEVCLPQSKWIRSRLEYLATVDP